MKTFKIDWHQVKTCPISTALIVAAVTCYIYSPNDVWSRLATSLDLGGLGVVIGNLEYKSSKKNKLHRQTLPYLRRISRIAPQTPLANITKPPQEKSQGGNSKSQIKND